MTASPGWRGRVVGASPNGWADGPAMTSGTS